MIAPNGQRAGNRIEADRDRCLAAGRQRTARGKHVQPSRRIQQLPVQGAEAGIGQLEYLRDYRERLAVGQAKSVSSGREMPNVSDSPTSALMRNPPWGVPQPVHRSYPAVAG